MARGKKTGKYRSKFEAKVSARIPGADYEPVKIKFVQPAKDRTYTPDFVLKNGIVIEAKGVLDAATRSKMILVRDQHPDLDIRFVFQRAANTISKRSKTTYGAWATKHGFLWAEGTVPQSWIDEPAQ